MFWVMIPAYNEDRSLPVLLPKIAKALETYPYRVVVVDDGSIDKTATVLEQLSAALPLDILTHALNRGLGETERDGFEFIAMRCEPTDIIIRVEADDTHEPQYIFSLVSKLQEGYDVVNTSRFQPGGGQLGVSKYRGWISRAANIFMKLVFRIEGTKDYSCGYRAYRAQVIQDAIKIFGNNFVQLRGLGFTSTLEIIVKLHLLGCRFAEVPFVLRYDQKGSSSKMVSSITTLGYLLMAVLYYWPFGGWQSQYRGLGKLYREDSRRALEKFGSVSFYRHTVSKISL
jgi:dolichol-phosphate mannosyltransferase